MTRLQQWSRLDGGTFDVAIVGAGINGASLYDRLCRYGYRVLLLDKRDFAGATSQASAMMIWGGLLYLAHRDFATVRELCASRERMLEEMPAAVRVCTSRFVATKDPGRSRWLLLGALYLYWALGGFRRRRPRIDGAFSEREFLSARTLRNSLAYEEATVEPSDARFTIHWILPHQESESVALNHCAVRGGAYDSSSRSWRLEIEDAITGRQTQASARCVVNAAGVWTDQLNDRFGVSTGWKHIFGKGVFLGVVRHPAHTTHLMFETRADGDCMSLIPWGPVSLWGPTETVARTPDAGFTVEPEDVRSLLSEMNRHLVRPVDVGDIVSLRCGVRPLAIRRSDHAHRGTFGISRRQVVVRDPHRPWISLYGGKLTGCSATARLVAADIRGWLLPSSRRDLSACRPITSVPDLELFPGLVEPVLSARHAAEREMCWTLEDYLRRRTNISQWVPRGGLGRNGEHAGRIAEIAAVFASKSGRSRDEIVAEYHATIERGLDDVIRRV
ncbi:MAG TPA: FAD-dependent oxidoreductase [Myxococcales bacterium]|nr:FAD-dependent oxidoreductase [Myxococcales bacterium]